MVSTRLKNISENANLLQVAVKIKDIWGHHLENNTGWLKFCHRSACDIHHHSPFRTFKPFKLYLVNTLSPNHLQPLVCHVVWENGHHWIFMNASSQATRQPGLISFVFSKLTQAASYTFWSEADSRSQRFPPFLDLQKGESPFSLRHFWWKKGSSQAIGIWVGSRSCKIIVGI